MLMPDTNVQSERADTGGENSDATRRAAGLLVSPKLTTDHLKEDIMHSFGHIEIPTTNLKKRKEVFRDGVRLGIQGVP